MNRTIFALLAWTAAAGVFAAPSCSRQSPAHSIALLELYTSEGCSSCPPADQFLRGLRKTGITDSQAVALSLHVDYWNYIGWKDPYSRAAFTERQRWLSDLAGSRTIYTPEFFVAGKELRSWSAGLRGAIERINAMPARATIHIAMGEARGGSLPIEVKASARQDAKLHVALVESAIASKVKAGENDGRTLYHDYVVREWLAPLTMRSGATELLARPLPLPPDARAANMALVAFVQSANGEVLQALALPACGG